MFSFRFGRKSKADSAASTPRAFNVENLEDRAVPAVFTVTTASDEGDGSLRDAVDKANALAGADSIQFAAALDGTPIFLTTGEILITDDLTIEGRAASATGISSNRASRILNAEASGKPINLTLNNLTLSGGTAGGDGGAVRLAGGKLTLNKAIVMESTAERGGGVAVLDANGFAGELAAQEAFIMSNKAAISGGGVFVSSAVIGDGGQNAVIANSSVVGNSITGAGGSGAGMTIDHGVAVISQSMFANNVSVGDGGGLTVGAHGSAWIANSTFAENAATAGLGGGGILSRNQLVITNSTVIANGDTGANGAGGIRHLGTTPMQISSTIVAENSAGSGATGSPDIQSSLPIASDGHNLIGKPTGLQGVKDGDLVNVSPKLGPRLDNGGLNNTYVPLADSPVIGKGSNPLGLATDQRGGSFARTSDGAVDIGATQFDRDNEAPTVDLYTAPDIGVGSNAFRYDFTVLIEDDAGDVNRGTIGDSDIVVTGPNGYKQYATAITVERDEATGKLGVAYAITPKSGGWTVLDNGTYTITFQSNEIFDAAGRPAAGKVLGSFKVDLYGDNLGYTRSLYRTILGRDGDNDGLAGYQKRLEAGESRDSIAREIWESEEHRTMQVQQYYAELLGRDAEAEGLAYWVDRFKQGASEEEVMAGIAGSKERLDQSTNTTGFTSFVFEHLLGRAAGADADAFVQSVQTDAAGAVKTVALSDEALERKMNDLYLQILMRQADADGRTWFVSQSREAGYGEAAIAMLGSDEYYQLHGTKV